MDFQHEKDRIFVEDTNHHLLAEVTFPLQGDHVCINHTYVSDTLRGQGVAGKLMEEAIKEIRSQNKRLTATCSYAISWLNKHEEAHDIWLDI